MRVISPADILRLLANTELFIKVFGSNNLAGGNNEFFKIPAWLEEMCDPVEKRHSKLSAYVQEDTRHFHDTRYFATKKDASTGFKLRRPENVAWFDPMLRQEIPIFPDPPFPGEGPAEARLNAEQLREEYEKIFRINQLVYNPRTSQVTVEERKQVRGLPKPGTHFQKKQPVTLLPNHLKTEFYHRTRLDLPLTFHIAFLFDKNGCDDKEGKYYFPFDAWTWAQWWVLPSKYSNLNGQFVPVEHRRFLPCFARPEFVQKEISTILEPAAESAVELSEDTTSLPPTTFPSTSTALRTPRSEQSGGSAAHARRMSVNSNPPRYTSWDPSIPLVAEHVEHAKTQSSVAFGHAAAQASELRRQYGETLVPTHYVTPPSRTRSRLSGIIDTEPDGYHLIFKSLGYEGLARLINNIDSYVSYFLRTFEIPSTANPEILAANEYVANLAIRMKQLNRLLLHNEVLIAPSPQSIVGVCLIPSKPLPPDFHFGMFYREAPNYISANKSFHEANKHRLYLIEQRTNLDIPIMLLDTFEGQLHTLYSPTQEEAEFINLTPSAPLAPEFLDRDEPTPSMHQA